MKMRGLIRSAEGMLVHVLEEDDGSGWVKVTDNHGGKGLVPASYLEMLDLEIPEGSGGSESPQAAGQFGTLFSLYRADQMMGVCDSAGDV
jgi:hypothetical protein